MYNKLYSKSSEFWTSTRLFVWKKVEQKFVINQLKIKENEKILEIGCNTGKFLARVVNGTKCEPFGIDINDYAIMQAKKNFPEFSFKKMDSAAMSFKPKFFDKVYSLHTLEHIPDYKKVLSETYRVLKKNGLFVLAVPTERKRGDLALGGIIFTGKNGHIHKFDYFGLSEDLKKTGFKIDGAYLCTGFPFTAVHIKKFKHPKLASFFSYSLVFLCTK